MTLDDLKITHHFGGGVYVKQTFVPANTVLEQHKHTFDHLSFVVSGMVIVECGSERHVMHGPSSILIKAGKAHAFNAITDSVVLCVHRTDVLDPELVDQTLVEA